MNQDAESRIGYCNVLVIGKAGVGKSTLINAVFGKSLANTGVGRSITPGIKQHSEPGCPITVYDTRGLGLSDKQIKPVKLEVSKLIKDKRIQNAEEHIHLVWYCIGHEPPRLDPVEESWINDLSTKDDVPVLIVITQTIEPEISEFLPFLQNEKARNSLQVCDIIPVLAQAKYDFKPHGLDRLVETTASLLPEVARKAFIREQIFSIDLKERNACNAVVIYIIGSFFAGGTPIPFADVAFVVSVQSTMVAHIANIFGVSTDSTFNVAVVAAMTGAGGIAAVGKVAIENLMKLLPGVGLFAGLIAGSTHAYLTSILGAACIYGFKLYLIAQIKGQEISLSELTGIIIDKYKHYLRGNNDNDN